MMLRNCLFLSAVALVLTACADTAAPVCVVEACESADVALDIQVVPDSFPHQLSSDHRPIWAPGDTILLRSTIHNYADTATDSLYLQVWVPGWTPYTYSTASIAGIVAHSKIVVLDTLVVADLTFSDSAQMNVSVAAGGRGNFRYVDAYWTGVKAFPVLSSGYEIEPIEFSFEKLLVRSGVMAEGIEQPVNVAGGALIRYGNPYQVDLPAMPVIVCVWDIDYCPWSDTTSLPALKAGQETTVEVPLNLQVGPRWDWYQRAETAVRICPHALFEHKCIDERANLLANFDVDCDAITITPGIPVTDTVAECPRVSKLASPQLAGSAFRFTANAGERYRLEQLDAAGNWQAAGFIVPSDGMLETDPRVPQLTIPTSGTYYGIVFHSGPVTIRLTKL